jgi:HEAT repeat protein
LGAVAAKPTTLAPSRSQILNSIIPALNQTLESADNKDIVGACMIALAKAGLAPKESAAFFRERLNSSSQEISETAGVSLGILQNVEALEILEQLLTESEQGRKLVGKSTGVPVRTRSFAAYGLGLLGSTQQDSAIQARLANTLWEVLSTDDDPAKDIRVACVIAIGLLKLDDPAPLADKLANYLADDSHDFLSRSHCPTAIAKLLLQTADDSPLRERAVMSFLDLETSTKTKTEIRQSCVQALGLLTPGNAPYAGKVFKALSKASDKAKDRQERNFTSIALAYIGASADDTSPVRKNVTAFLIKKLEKGKSAYKPWAGLALGVMAFRIADNGGQVSPLVHSTTLAVFNKTKSPSPKAAYAISLGLMANEGAKESLRQSMDKISDLEYRGYASVALGLLTAREYKDYISQIVQESKRKPQLLRQASIALGLMKDREVVDILLGLLSPDGKRMPRLAVLSAAAMAIGFIGDRRSVDPLITAMKDEKMTKLARAFSAIGLGMVADKDNLPWNSIIASDLNYRAATSTLVDKASSSGILDIL